VALQQRTDKESRIVAAAIYDPVRDRCFHATLGGGAFCDATPIKVSDVQQVDKALVAASLPPRVERDSDEIRRFVDVMLTCQAIRRLGSAALNLCYVACGQLDAYWATSVKQWDVAAGLLIVEEAGGTVTRIDGEELCLEEPKFISAGTTELHQQMVKLLNA
jgi:myo-inositol-1(or 4)-monophosphatase